MPYSVKILRGLDELDPKVKGVILDLLEEIEKNTRESVKRSDFDELKAAFTELTKTVNELAEAQKRSEERLTRVEIAIEQLTEAQKRSEERLTRVEIAIEQLTEAQKKTEIKLNELAEAQKRSEERLTRVEIAIEQLAEAQKKTEIKFNELAEVQKNTIERLEGISNSVGYSLENNAYKGLPDLLKKEGIDVEGRIIRKYYEENQINIWGSGKKNGETLLILGEVKVRPSKKEIDRFLRIVDKIITKERKNVFTVFVAHDYHPNIERYLTEKGIKYYWSYELE